MSTWFFNEDYSKLNEELQFLKIECVKKLISLGPMPWSGFKSNSGPLEKEYYFVPNSLNLDNGEQIKFSLLSQHTDSNSLVWGLYYNNTKFKTETDFLLNFSKVLEDYTKQINFEKQKCKQELDQKRILIENIKKVLNETTTEETKPNTKTTISASI